MSRNEIGSDTAEGRMQKRIISALRKRGGEMLKSELTAALRGDAASRRVREEALKDLVEEGVVLRREEQVAKTTREIFTLVEWRLAQ
jgi:DNA-binding HxlR family transcriptional regulator